MSYLVCLAYVECHAYSKTFVCINLSVWFISLRQERACAYACMCVCRGVGVWVLRAIWGVVRQNVGDTKFIFIRHPLRFIWLPLICVRCYVKVNMENKRHKKEESVCVLVAIQKCSYTYFIATYNIYYYHPTSFSAVNKIVNQLIFILKTNTCSKLMLH